jgi:ATP-dependent Clp protease, protease subunit
MTTIPLAVRSAPMAKARPGALPMPHERSVHAFTKPEVMDRWAEEQAGVRPAALAAGDAVITMFDIIGEDYWSGGGITAKKVAAQLRAIGDRPVEVQINSPGGDMFEGIAVYNVLREHPQDVTVKVMGMAASAASIIAMAGDRIEIGAASFLMIHNCWVLAIGNRHDMAETSAWLAPFDQAMADVYALRSGQDAKACAAWMDAETFMSGSVAVERGFADALLAADQVTNDEDARTTARDVNELRGLERTLIASGKSRTEARAAITKIKGQRDATREGPRDAADPMGEAFERLKQALTI